MPKYPDALLEWSGNRAGGVKKLFYEGSGRPIGKVIKTNLLAHLEGWAMQVAARDPDAPRAILLLGGPGNGKTEAIEETIRNLDRAYGLHGKLVAALAAAYDPGQGSLPPRLVEIDMAGLSGGRVQDMIGIVQDASEASPGFSQTPAELLCADLAGLASKPRSARIYLACVNRGVLDDALIIALERRQHSVERLLKQMIRSASLSVDGAPCWPLQDFPWMAIWPMDAETLVESQTGDIAPFDQVLELATDPLSWPEYATCEAGDHCPFCTNRKLLATEPYKSSFARILRWYELSSGKRWSFRDLFSLMAHVFAGIPSEGSDAAYSPCKWAYRQINVLSGDPSHKEARRKRGTLRLLAVQYQHAIFADWPTERAAGLRRDMVELKLVDFPPLVALHQFLALDKRKESTSTLRSQLAGIAGLLDPALANPACQVAVSANSRVKYEDLDRRFSLSIKEGRIFIQKYQCLSPIEISALKILEEIDSKLSEHAVRRQRPATAERVQGLARIVACRIVRRSIGARAGVTKDSEILDEFHRVVRGDPAALQQAAKQVEKLLNEQGKFQVCLNSTFGEPMPPRERRVSLVTDIQRVKPMQSTSDARRPLATLRFLKVGSSDQARPVALTYELFRATKSLGVGMLPASLPRSVVALLDTTRASLAGAIVRNEEALDGSEIRLGARPEIVERTSGQFVVRTGE